MSVDPSAALDRLIEAFQAHLKVLASGRTEDDPAFQKAQDILISAFETYDESLYDAYEIDTPFLVYDDDDVEEDDFDDAGEDDGALVVEDFDVVDADALDGDELDSDELQSDELDLEERGEFDAGEADGEPKDER